MVEEGQGPDIAAKEAETQAKESETQAKEAETPAKESETQAKEPETPKKEPEITVKKPEPKVKPSVTIKETPGLVDPKARQNANDEELCKKIVDALAGEKAKRVLLQGEAGIGKTRLAKLVGQYAIDHDLSFLTLCLHLNQEFKADKLNFEEEKPKSEVEKLDIKQQYALYQNIASQLFVYSDFEETEVDDRDEEEEEEKTPDVLLAELKKKIGEEINGREKAALDKDAAEKKKRDEAKNKSTSEANRAKHKRGLFHLTKEDKKPENTAGENPNLSAGDSAGKVEIPEKKRYLLLILDDEGNKTSEKVVMEKLGLAKFLKDTFLLNDEVRLKIIVTKRKEDKKPGESHDTKSQDGNEEKDDAKSESQNQSDTEGISEAPEAAGKNDGKGVPPTGDMSEIYGGIKIDTDESDFLRYSNNQATQHDLFLSLASEEWKTDVSFIKKMVENSMNSPAAIAVLANSLKQVTRVTYSELTEKIVKVIEKILSYDQPVPSKPSSNSESTINQIFHLANSLLETFCSSPSKSKDDKSDEFNSLLNSIKDQTLRDYFRSLALGELKTEENFNAKIVEKSNNSPAAIAVLANSLEQIFNEPKDTDKESKEKEKEPKEKEKELKEKIVKIVGEINKVISAVQPQGTLNPVLQLANVVLETCATLDMSKARDALTLSFPSEEWRSDKKIIDKIVEKSNNSPAAIKLLANSLRQIPGGTFSELKNKIEKEIEKIIPEPKEKVIATEQPEPAEEMGIVTVPPESTEAGSSSETTITINPIFRLAYVLLEKFCPSKSKDAILHCFWHSLDFFDHCGCVYYRELITQWILEGYFDPVRSVEKAYKAGHAILMELINRGMLKIQENNVVVPEMAMSILIDPRRRGHLGRSRLGFSRVYAGDKAKGIGKITQIDDMIKTVQAKKRDEITTILVGGDRLRRVTPERYFKKLGHLEVLGLFEPTLDPFLSALLKINQKKSLLRVLVIRDCDLLDNIEELKNLPALNALEVSGASSLKKIRDGFFKDLPKLESLHLSGLQITTSPSSISELLELHCLIIRDCPLLEDLPDVQKLVKLEVVDVSGARGLQTCFDNKKGEQKDKSKNKNFYKLEQLQVLDFSESQIERLPIFQDSAEPKKLHKVTRLLLRNCSKLRRLPSLKPLSGLQILDLSGTSNLVEMLEVCFEDKKELKTLNLSGTNLAELADTINELESLNELLLKNATKLETIPKIDDLEKLEVIDVSGSTKLKTIDGSFEKMHYLREVDLSGTDIKDVPKLPTESKMCCEKLITLPDGRKFKGAKWEDIEAKIEMSKTPEEANTSEISEEASISKAVVESQGIIEKKSEEVVRIQPNEPRASDGSEKGDVSKERLLQVPKEKNLYSKTLLLVDPAFRPDPEGMVINGTNAIDWKALEKAEFVYLVDVTSTMLPSIFEKAKSMKGCWLRFCIDIKDLFAGVAADHLEKLVNLYITNLPSLEIISSGGNLKNLKNITIEYCPIIKALFPEAPPKPVPVPEPAKKSSSVPEATQKPTTPEVVEIKHLDSLETLSITNLPLLETISRGASLDNLKNLTVGYCPKIKTLFHEAAQIPSSLKVVHLKHCDTLEEIFEVGEARSDLLVKKENCAKFKGNYEEISEEISEEMSEKISDWVMVTPPEEA